MMPRRCLKGHPISLFKRMAIALHKAAHKVNMHQRYRCSICGSFVPHAYASAYPKTTQSEQRK